MEPGKSVNYSTSLYADECSISLKMVINQHISYFSANDVPK